MTAEQKLLIDALALSVAGKSFELPESVDWRQFIGLCRMHAVEALVYNGLQKADLWNCVPEPGQKILTQAYQTAIFRDAQFTHLKNTLTRKLTEAQVPYILLKGICLKESYPEPALRTMCDMDILVHTEDYPVLDRIAKEMQAVSGHSDGNHRNFSFPGGITVEFHPNLLHHATPVGTQINPGWQYAQENGNSLTPEGFYLNTLCHLANHFVAGGVGVRFVVDVWVNRHLRKPEMDRKKVEEELGRFGLLEFVQNIEDLAELWFGRGEETPLLAALGEYILTAGRYGTADRAVLNSVALAPGQSRTSALLKKAFYSREELEDRFPWCKGKPYLLPAAWCTRCFRAVTRRGDLILKWSKKTGQVSDAEVKAQKNLLEQFGIRPEK
jgi:hypothetical protein